MERCRDIDEPNRTAARSWAEAVWSTWKSRFAEHEKRRSKFLIDQYLEKDDWVHIDGFFQSLLADTETLTCMFNEACSLPERSDFARFWTVGADSFVGYVDGLTLSALEGHEQDDAGRQFAAAAMDTGENSPRLVDKSKTHLHRAKWPLVTSLAASAAERVWLEGWDPDRRDAKRPWRVPLIGTALRSIHAQTEWPHQFPEEIQVVRQGGGRAKAPFLEWTNDICEEAGIRIGMPPAPEGLSEATWNQVRSCGKTIRTAMTHGARTAGSEYEEIADLFDAGDATP